jgi:hypothetical protein
MAEVMEAPVVINGVQLKDGNYTFQLLNKVTPRVPTDPPFPQKFALSTSKLSYDPVTKRGRTARFIPGIESFWMDAQDKVEKNYADMNAWRPEFMSGVLNLQYPQDAEKIIYLISRDDFDGKTNRVGNDAPVFTLVNRETDSASDLEMIEIRHEAEGKALKANFEDMKNHSIFLGIPTSNADGELKEKELRKLYCQKATENPSVFLKSIDSPVAKLTSQIKTAIKNGFIDTSHVKNQAHYGETKALIITLDPKRTAVEQLVEHALGNPKFKSEIEKFAK